MGEMGEMGLFSRTFEHVCSPKGRKRPYIWAIVAKMEEPFLNRVPVLRADEWTPEEDDASAEGRRTW